MKVGKPRRRRVWGDPPETRKAWKRAKRADLEGGRFTRHLSDGQKRKRLARVEQLAQRAADLAAAAKAGREGEGGKP